MGVQVNTLKYPILQEQTHFAPRLGVLLVAVGKLVNKETQQNTVWYQLAVLRGDLGVKR